MMRIDETKFDEALDTVGERAWNAGFRTGYQKGFGDAVNKLNKAYLDLLVEVDHDEKERRRVEID